MKRLVQRVFPGAWLAGVLCAGMACAGLVWGGAVWAAAAAPATRGPGGPPAADLRPTAAPARPGQAPLGLRYFRLAPGASDTTFRLLVIPVRFPEDRDLGRTRAELVERLSGAGAGSLRAYWDAATHGRMRVETTLAPTVTAAHARTFYTSEGTGNNGYGTDPGAYPHNAQYLVEEATRAVENAVDLRRYDNNGDGIVDGLLLLHSGPRAPEVVEAGASRSLMAAHAFTTPAPVARRDAVVFPYAIASARDPIGPWAHEMGHLLGFPDEYVSSVLCPGEGVGKWSLMATGSDLGAGTTPAGLDAFCRQILGFAPVAADGEWIPLENGAFVRAFAPGAASGPAYFLVERRTIDNGGVAQAATVVYAVNEDAVDNRNCTRPLVEVRAELCADVDLCLARLDDATTPNLRDADGNATGLVLDFAEGSVRVSYASAAPLRLERVRLLAVEAGGTRQRVELTVRNLRLDAAVGGQAVLAAVWPAVVRAVRLDDSIPGQIPPQGTLIDTSWALEPLDPIPVFSGRSQELEIRLVPGGEGLVATDTVTVVAGTFGFAAGRLDTFTSRRLDANDSDPWTRDGTAWIAGPLERRVNAELVSPYFTVPDRATAFVAHAWDLAALSPDVALDAAQVRVLRDLAPATAIAPPGGWGYTVERGIGNAMGGHAALGGSGDRSHVFDLSGWAGETVRLSLRVAGDAQLQESTWRIRDVSVAAAPEVAGALSVAGGDRGEPILEGTLTGGADRIAFYVGPSWGTPPVLFADAADTDRLEVGLGALFAGDRTGLPRRCEMVWRVDGAYASTALVVDPPSPARVLLPPGPNPATRGQGQTWVLGVPAGERTGVFHLDLFTVGGRRVVERAVRIDAHGLREVLWDGRDFGGRVVPPGVYFLRCRRPDGATESTRVVVIP